MKIPGVSFFSHASARPRATAPSLAHPAAQDRLELSSPNATDRPQTARLSLKSLPLQRLTTIGMGALCLFGSLVATVTAHDNNPPPKPSATYEVVFKAPEPGLDGWLLGPGGPKSAVTSVTIPDNPPQFTLSQPAAAKHDYQKHGVNFSQLISNQEFTDTTALDSAGIQKFLESRGSFLADFEENGRSAAQILSATARESGLNPYVLLTTLEKENSLISRQKTPNKALLAASMGYGYTDGGTYTAGANSFTGQVTKGAQLLSKLYSEAQGQTFPQKFSADYGKRKVQINNAATLALFRYTPHTVDTGLRQVGGGNYLFRNILEDFTRPTQD